MLGIRTGGMGLSSQGPIDMPAQYGGYPMGGGLMSMASQLPQYMVPPQYRTAPQAAPVGGMGLASQGPLNMPAQYGGYQTGMPASMAQAPRPQMPQMSPELMAMFGRQLLPRATPNYAAAQQEASQRNAMAMAARQQAVASQRAALEAAALRRQAAVAQAQPVPTQTSPRLAPQENYTHGI